MEMESTSHEKNGVLFHWRRRLKALSEKVKEYMGEAAVKAKKLGQDDPRRVIHSLKVGLALSMVSLFYYFQPLYDSFGVSAMWAVMTVVVVFEFSVGATLGKGLNRMLATFVGGALGVGLHHLASLFGDIGEPIVLGFFVFLQAAAMTFIRFFPRIKARYDYGMLIFMLTFSLVSVSGFRDNEIIELAHKRFSTIVIGSLACLVISIFVCPVWAGEDLHNLIALNMEKLGQFLEGFGSEFFKVLEEGEPKNDKSYLQEYKSALNTKSNEESLANFARWEPGHGRFKFRHPWKEYLNIGVLIRQCACRIEALSGYLINAESRAPEEMLEKIQDACMKLSSETGKALIELSWTLNQMTHSSSAGTHIMNSKSAAENLKCLLKSRLWKEDTDLLEVIPMTTVASLLIETSICTEKIAESVHELASLAHFKSLDPSISVEKSPSGKRTGAKQLSDNKCPHVSIAICGPSLAFQESGTHNSSVRKNSLRTDG